MTLEDARIADPRVDQGCYCYIDVQHARFVAQQSGRSAIYVYRFNDENHEFDMIGLIPALFEEMVPYLVVGGAVFHALSEIEFDAKWRKPWATVLHPVHGLLVLRRIFIAVNDV